MKKCPCCAENIQDVAVKCMYCGEWLEQTKNHRHHQLGMSDEVSTKFLKGCSLGRPSARPLVLSKISRAKTIGLIFLLPSLVILMDIIFVWIISPLEQEMAYQTQLLILGSIAIFLGIWIADYLYKIKNAVAIIITSFILLFFLRFLILIFFIPELIETAMINTLMEGSVVFGSAFLFRILFLRLDTKFDYSYVKDEHDSEDLATKKKVRRGTCSKCGLGTVSAKERFISFLGMSAQYFCDNCGRFIKGNPFNSVIVGATVAAASMLVLIGYFANIAVRSTYTNIFILILLVGVYDGIKRAYYGIIEVIKPTVKKKEGN